MSETKKQPEIFSDQIIYDQLQKVKERINEVVAYMKGNPKEENVRVYMTQWIQNLNGLPRI